MRKRIPAFILTACMVGTLALTGCSGTISQKEATSGADATSIGTETGDAAEETTAPDETVTENREEEYTMDTADVDLTREIVLDKDSALTAENTLYDGLGFISANNSSRLLLDYKDENPEAYWEILNYMFGSEGLHMSLIKIEMGADVDSSSGTEPAMKRSADEIADATRGAGAQLVADALTINPDIDVDMLYWGIPAWVMNAEDTNEAMYQWYKSTIEAMYDEYGIVTTYVTLSQNEKSINADMIKYIANALNNETDERYDYSQIQIVAGEGVTDWTIADKMLEDEELMEAVDVISSHYTSYTSDNALLLQSQYGKKIWFSEGSSPMKAASLTSAKEDTGNGISGLNGMLDIATRITQAITDGMTMYEFQPAVAAYYSGATYFPKQLITANTPWNGGYTFDAGFYMGLQFSQFFKKGMSVVRDACYGDGVPGGDGHAIVDSTYNYASMIDTETDDYSTVVVNNSEHTIQYTLKLGGLASTDRTVHLYETCETGNSEDYFEGFYQNVGYIKPTLTEDGAEITFVVKPYSMMSVTTLDVAEITYKDRSDETEGLSLPYEDDFEYADYEADYLESRGMAPRYTTDEGGAFEVVSTSEGNVLMQKINSENKPTDWGSTSNPITNLGDDTWKDYTVSIDVHFAEQETESKTVNFVGIGARYNLAENNQSGYWLKFEADGNVSIMKNSKVMVTDTLAAPDVTSWHDLKLSVIGSVITAYIDDEEVLSYTDTECLINSGRVGIFSAYQNNYFDNLKVEAADENYRIARVDDMDSSLTYSEGTTDSDNVEDGTWLFSTMSSFKNFNRTMSTGTVGCSVGFGFTGSEFALLGSGSNGKITVAVDGENVAEDIDLLNSTDRTASYVLSGLSEGEHEVTVTVTDGKLVLDAVEYR